MASFEDGNSGSLTSGVSANGLVYWTIPHFIWYYVPLRVAAEGKCQESKQMVGNEYQIEPVTHTPTTRYLLSAALFIAYWKSIAFYLAGCLRSRCSGSAISIEAILYLV